MKISVEDRDSLLTIVAGASELHLTEQQARDLMRHLQTTLYRMRPGAQQPMQQVATCLPVDLSKQGREFP